MQILTSMDWYLSTIKYHAAIWEWQETSRERLSIFVPRGDLLQNADVQDIMKYLAQRNENIADASCTAIETHRQIQMIQIQSS